MIHEISALANDTRKKIPTNFLMTVFHLCKKQGRRKFNEVENLFNEVEWRDKSRIHVQKRRVHEN